MFTDKKMIESVLTALSEQIDAGGTKTIEIVVCGGAALNILGYVARTTIDVDIMAFVDSNKSLVKDHPISARLHTAAENVGKDFNLPSNWLNTGPSSIIDLGLPEGLMGRTKTFRYGNKLIVHFLDRYDQIHFKLYAAADQTRTSIHYHDLIALKPAEEELLRAAEWCKTQDVSFEFRKTLKELLSNMGFKNAAGRI